MTRPIRALAIPFLVAVTQAQDAIYYKFTSGGGTRVINYGTGDSTVPREGTIEHHPSRPLAKAWGKGRYGMGLAAGPVTHYGYQVDTGWPIKINGNATISFFIRMVYALPTNDNAHIVGFNNPGGISVMMDGDPTRRGWLHFTWGSYRRSLQQNIYSLAAAGWVHVAISVDTSKKLLVWYINGKPGLPVSIQSWGRIQSTKNLQLSYTDDAYWTLDEFRLSLRAVPAAEIAAWASTEPAAHAPFEKSCHPFGRAVILDGAAGGPPKIGNSSYRLTVYGLPQSVVALGLGSNNQSFGGAPLPLDLKILNPQLAGCFLRTSAEFVRFGTVGPTGALSFSLPIPNISAASGAKLYSQALLTSSTLKATMLTNAYATVVGKQ